jgi:hypothetical protein
LKRSESASFRNTHCVNAVIKRVPITVQANTWWLPRSLTMSFRCIEAERMTNGIFRDSVCHVTSSNPSLSLDDVPNLVGRPAWTGCKRKVYIIRLCKLLIRDCLVTFSTFIPGNRREIRRLSFYNVDFAFLAT